MTPDPRPDDATATRDPDAAAPRVRECTATAIVDADGAVVRANASLVALVGPIDAGASLADRLDPRDRPTLRAAIRGGADAAFDVRLPRGGGGEPLVLACTFTPVAPGRACVALTPAVDRRRDARELRQLQFMADEASDAFFLVDEDSTIVYANRVAHAERGWAPGELIGRPTSDVNPTYSVARVNGLFDDTANGASFRLSHAHRRKDGSTFPVESSVNRLELDGRRYLFSAARDVTTSRAAEDAIRAERERMAIVVQQSNVGVWFAPLPLGDFTWDAKVKEHFFLPPDAPANAEVFYARMHPDDRAPTAAAIARSAAERVPYDVIYRTVAPDGSAEKSIRALGRTHYDAAGTPVMLDGVTFDVTQQVRDAAALRESEARFREMADHAPVMVWVTDAAGACTFLNERWYTFTGQAEADALGFGWLDATHPDDAAAAHDAFVRANAAREHFEVEYRLRRHDGAYRWCLDSAEPRFGANGEYLGYVGSVIDVTDRKLAAERVRESEARLQLAAAIAQMGLYDIDLASDALIVNDAARAIYGWDDPAFEPTFATLRAARHPDDADRTAAAIAAACAPGGTARYDVEQRITRGDGRLRWIRIRGLAIFDAGPDRPATRIVGAFVDTTDQKEGDVRRERLLAAEHAARVEAEAAARLKDEFLTTLSHELRTPLNAILGWATLLRRGNKSADPGVAKGLETIDRNARVQAQVISDLLDVRQIVAGSLSLDVADDVDLAAVVRECLDVVRPAADAKSIRLEARGLDARLLLRGDRARLRQVASNLLANAVKFTPRDGVVRVAVSRLDGGGGGDGRLELRVSDTGQGISPEFLPHVFDRFRQADASTTRRHGGLGLGLAIVRPLVEMHGGTIAAESGGTGHGATFIVRLPTAAPTPPTAI